MKNFTQILKLTILAVALFNFQQTNAQQIDIRGNGNLINNGGINSPAINNQTNFGTTNESAGVITKVFTITNAALLGNLTLGSITIGGANASDFTLIKPPATPVAPFGGNTTFEINFNPSALGLRVATFSIVTNVAGKNPYTFNLSGTGTSFPTQSYTLFYENFDANNGGWTASSFGGSSWNYTNTPYRGEGNYWMLGNNYNNGTQATLTSPIISSSGYSNIRVSLDLRYLAGDSDDGMQIQYSTNGGLSWIVLGNYVEGVTWYNANNISALSSSIGNTSGFTGNGGSSTAAPFNEFFEKSTQSNELDNRPNLRFRVVFYSDNGINDVGVAIDNFYVKGDPIVAPVANTNNPGNVGTNLKLWLKSNAGTSTSTDGASLTQWNDQAQDNNAVAIGVARPVYRDGTRNINFNPVVEFSPATAAYMRGKGGFFSQDYYVVVKSNATIDSSLPTRQVPISGRTSANSFQVDGTGFALGNFTIRFMNELISHSISSVPQISATTSSYGRAYTTTTETYPQETTIYNVKTNTTGTSTEIYKNGKRIDNTTGQYTDATGVTLIGNLNFAEFQNIQYNLGVGRFSLNGNIPSFLDGRLSEIISYSDIKSASEKKKIESYLAIKNGVTLHDVASATVNSLCDTYYTDSSGSTIWDNIANNGYNYNIAGIGRDDITQLNQKQSTSENIGTILTIGLTDIYPTNNLNTSTFTTNKSFLLWGDNGANMNTSVTPFSVNLGPTTITTITDVVNRRWKIVETGGDVATTRLSVPTAAFASGLPALGPTDAYVMLIADDAGYTSNIETVFMTTSGANQTLTYDFDGTRYFTFGVAHRATNPLHISMDGFDDFVRIGDFNELTANFSIMTWIRPNGSNTLNDERNILSKKIDATGGYKLVLQNNNKVRMEWTVAGTTYSLITNTSLPDQIWHNIAVTYTNGGLLNIYIDGVLDKSSTILVGPSATAGIFSIGSNYINKNSIKNLFKGDIDELRMWSRVLSATEIRFIMNQEILQNGTGTKGTIIPATVSKNDVSSLLWSNLFAYYSMNSYIGTHLDDDSGNVHRGSLIIPNKISINVQTAPMPYISNANGNWSNTATWFSGNIQQLANSLSIIDGITPIDWNIVRTLHNVDSNGNKVVLGLLVNSNTLSASNDTKIEVSHYLKLNGKIDLVGKSQLIQTLNSDLDPTSAGNLERDQLGQRNIFNYNYWSSPVGAINNTTNNNSYTVAGVMKDGTTTTPQNITFTTGYNGSATSPITISNYWIFKFQNVTNAYANWQAVGSAGSLLPGQGYTMKGSGAASNQNYTFVGKPNNGAITSPIAANNLNLSGNPYASALDANAFISANASSLNGTLYFWEHFSTNVSHVTAAYQGGYAARTLVGGTPPVAPTGSSGLGSSSKIPARYIPAGQGFFVVGSATGGSISFNNDQRGFVKENDPAGFTMFKSTPSQLAINHFSDNRSDRVLDDSYKRIRLGETSKEEYHRQVLLGFMENNATSGIDPMYDGIHIDSQPSDMYFMNGSTKLNINGDSFFNIDNVYPIGIKALVAGEIKLMVDETEHLDSDVKIYIHDKLDQTYHEITNDTFTVEVPQGVTENRFEMTFKNTSTTLSTANNESISEGIKIAYTSEKNILIIKNNVADATVESVSLFNILGQSIGTWNVKDQSQLDIELPIKNVATGTYIVKVKTDKGDTNRKIMFN